MVRKKAKTTTGLTNPKSKVNLTITPEAKNAMDAITKEMGLTRSALFEGLLSGSISLSNHTSEPHSDASFNEDKSASLSPEKVTDNTEELDNYKNKITVLEKELENNKNLLAKQEDINASIQQELDSKLAIIKALETKVNNDNPPSNSDDKVTELQQVISEKEGAIASLKNKIEELENALKTVNDSGIKSEAKEDNSLIEQLQHQLEEKNNQINELAKRTTQSNSSENISHKLTIINEQQKRTIIHLEKRISELETVASIGQQTLNKWRAKSF